MSDRDEEIARFLGRHGLANTNWKRLPSDASERSYIQLEPEPGRSLILMDAPPEANLKTDQFIELSERLKAAGLVVPSVHEYDLDAGLVLLEDLGPQTAAFYLEEHPNMETEVYSEILNSLIKVEYLSIPDLQRMDSKVAGEMVEISAVHYADRPDLSQALNDLTTGCFTQFCGDDLVLALRDFHVENVIWRSDRDGSDRVGLLDYQDAFLAPRGYDLVSLLRDVRRDVSSETQAAMVTRYKSHHGLGSDFDLQLRCLAIQRNLRILGVFGRLIRVFGKQKYTVFLSRTWNLIMQDTNSSEFNDLRQLLRSEFPEPSPQLLQKWAVTT